MSRPADARPARDNALRRNCCSTLTALGALTLLVGACAAPAQIPAKGRLAGTELRTTVDADAAADYLACNAAGRELHRRLLQQFPRPDRDAVRRITRAYSADVAALHFARVTAGGHDDRVVRSTFDRELDALRGGTVSTDVSLPRVVFVPGWLYRRQPETGADFARQRMLLDRLGQDWELVDTDENAPVEFNAAILATRLRELGDTPVILVSASKAGAEVLEALHELHEQGAAGHVRAWVNVGGLLFGSPLADWGRAWYRRPFTTVVAHHRGHGTRAFASLTTRRGDLRRDMTLPPDILVVNYVGVPLSGQMDYSFGYRRIRRHGANDGLALLPDLVWPGGATVLEPGLDHYFADPEINRKTVAIVRMVAALLRGDAAAPASYDADGCAP